MAVTYRYLGVDDDFELVLGWFRSLPKPPLEYPKDSGVLLYFDSLGTLAKKEDDIEVKRSPLLSIHYPVRRNSILWTAGEVHFHPTPLRKLFPQLNQVSQQFSRWLKSYQLVFQRSPSFQGQWNYYLEGSIRNFDSDVYALPKAFVALEGCQYFVSEGDTDHVLDRLCRSLRLRGIESENDA